MTRRPFGFAQGRLRDGATEGWRRDVKERLRVALPGSRVLGSSTRRPAFGSREMIGIEESRDQGIEGGVVALW